MELSRRTGPTGDPFWDVVRRRHPDVDIVLLPPEQPGAAALGGSISLHTARVATDLVARTWASVVPVLAERGIDEPPAVRWRGRRGGHALVLRRAATGLGRDGGVALLNDVGNLLDGAGWRVGARELAQRVVLLAANGLVDVRVDAGAGGVEVEVATGLMPVSEADRATLRAEVIACL